MFKPSCRDVVMVLDDFDQPWLEIRCTSEIVSRLSLEYDISISLIPMRERTLRAGASPLARNILDTFRSRQTADYDSLPEVSEQSAREMLAQARAFLSMAERTLGAED